MPENQAPDTLNPDTLNPYSAILDKIAPQQIKLADQVDDQAGDSKTTNDETLGAIPSVLDKIKPTTAAPEKVEETAAGKAEETTTKTKAAVVEKTETPTEDNFFNDPLKNKQAPDPNKENLDYADRYRQLNNHPDFALFESYIRAGKGLGDLVNEHQNVDYRKMDLPTLTNEYGKLKGYTPDEVEEAMTELNGLGKLSRDREVETMQNILEQNQSNKNKNLAGDANKIAELNSRIRSQYVSEVQQIQRDMLGKSYNGVTLDQEKVNQWMQFAGEFSLQREDKSLATEKVFEYWLTKLIPKIQSIASSNGHHQGREEILKEISRPMKETPSNNLPIVPGGEKKMPTPSELTKQMTQSPSIKT